MRRPQQNHEARHYFSSLQHSFSSNLLSTPHSSSSFYPCLSETDDKYLCTTKRWSLWLIILRLVEAVRCYCCVFAVFFWEFLRIMCGCIWTDFRVGIGWFLEIIAQRKKHAPHTPFLREEKKPRLRRFDTWHFPATLRRSIFHQAVVSKLDAWVLHDFKKELKYYCWTNFQPTRFETFK